MLEEGATVLFKTTRNGDQFAQAAEICSIIYLFGFVHLLVEGLPA